MEVLKGLSSSPGIVIEKAYVVNRCELVVSEKHISLDEMDAEIERFENAVERAKTQLKRISASLLKSGGGETAADIIDAQLYLLNDITLIDEVIALVNQENKNPEYILEKKIDEAIRSIRNADDDYLKERVDHLIDVKRRLLANLLESKHQTIISPEEERILVVDHLAPSETVRVYHSNFVGIVTEMGGVTSHISIMARTMEIPAVIGLEGITKKVTHDSTLILDGEKGTVIIDPDEPTKQKYLDFKQEFRRWKLKFEGAKELTPITKDNHRITLAANIELLEEIEVVKSYNAEGVGLFRTEVLYSTQQDFPSQEQQYQTYLDASEQVKPQSIIIRTFDIGGDKVSHSEDHRYEPNPFLGWRAIRIGLSYPNLLKNQMKAILRAAAKNKNIKIIFPLLSNLDEIRKINALLQECKDELRAQNIPFDENMEAGVMIEVPSAAIIARDLAKYVDFFSIGSNDLVQYTLAVDRGNARVADLYQSYNPAILKLIKFTVDSGHLEGIWVGLCGQIAGDPKATAMLLGMGLDEFSTNPVLVPEIKTVIRALKFSDCRNISEKVIKLHTEQEVLDLLKQENKRLLPSELFEHIYQ